MNAKRYMSRLVIGVIYLVLVSIALALFTGTDAAIAAVIWFICCVGFDLTYSRSFNTRIK
jgi:uncharacterized YccA/Bax inhibitor family protein